MRRAAHAGFQLAHCVSNTADALRKLILREIKKPPPASQPRAEKRVTIPIGLLGLAVRHLVPLSVDQT